MAIQLWRTLGVRAAAGRLASRTRSPFSGMDMRHTFKRARKRTTAALDRALTSLRSDRKTQVAVAGVALATVAAGLLARSRRH